MGRSASATPAGSVVASGVGPRGVRRWVSRQNLGHSGADRAEPWPRPGSPNRGPLSPRRGRGTAETWSPPHCAQVHVHRAAVVAQQALVHPRPSPGPRAPGAGLPATEPRSPLTEPCSTRTDHWSPRTDRWSTRDRALISPHRAVVCAHRALVRACRPKVRAARVSREAFHLSTDLHNIPPNGSLQTHIGAARTRLVCIRQVRDCHGIRHETR